MEQQQWNILDAETSYRAIARSRMSLCHNAGHIAYVVNAISKHTPQLSFSSQENMKEIGLVLEGFHRHCMYACVSEACDMH